MVLESGESARAPAARNSSATNPSRQIQAVDITADLVAPTTADDRGTVGAPAIGHKRPYR